MTEPQPEKSGEIDWNRVKLIERARKFLALAESTNPQEAEVARTRARAFIYKHDITQEELEDEDAIPGHLIIKHSRFRAAWRIILWKLVTLPLHVALARRLDAAGGGARVILKGLHGDCKYARLCYLRLELAIENAAMLQPEAHASEVWRADFCRGAADAVGLRWRDHCLAREREKSKVLGKPPPSMPMDPQGPLAGDQIFIPPVSNRIALHVGIRFGNGFDLPPPRKPKKKRRAGPPKLLTPVG